MKKTVTTAGLDETTRAWARAGALASLEKSAQGVRDAFPELQIKISVKDKSTPDPAATPAAEAPEPESTKPAATKKPRRRIMPPEARKKIARKMRARWRARKSAGKNHL